MSAFGGSTRAKITMQIFPVLSGAGPHDVYPAPDGTVWFTAQSSGKLGRLDPRTGRSDLIALGPGAEPHGVIVGPDGAAWVTEGGQNAVARVVPRPAQSGFTRSPRSGATPTSTPQPLMGGACSGSPDRTAFMAASTPKQARWRCSMRRAAPVPMASPPRQTARCSLLRLSAAISVRSMSRPAPSQCWSRPRRAKARGAFGATAAAGCGSPVGTAAISSKTKSWAHWRLPGDGPQPNAFYVDDTDAVWVSDWGANAILRFDPKTEKFEAFPLPDRDTGMRQLAGRKGEV